MNSFASFVVSFALPFVLHSYMSGATVQHHPDSPARLGSGFNPATPEQVYAVPYIAFDGSENIDTSDTGVTSAGVEITQITDRKSLLGAVGVSASIEARARIYSGSTSFSNSVGVTFDSSSVVWLATSSVTFGRWRTKNPRANATLLNAATPDLDLGTCGSEIFTQETRGATASVVFEVRDVSSRQKNELAAAISASAKSPNRGCLLG